MTQGAEFDLIDIRYYTKTSEIQFVSDNEPIEDLNANTLTVDDKAILARDTAQTVEADFNNHQGGKGTAEHDVVTTAEAGFMSAVDKSKLDNIADGAQVNIISPTDALELVSTGQTFLHSHPNVTDTISGYMTATQKSKLNTVADGAQVNYITDPQADTLTLGGNASSLHSHTYPSFVETFTEAIHATTDHTGLPDITPFVGFTQSSFNLSNTIVGGGSDVYVETYPFTPRFIAAGIAYMSDASGHWGNHGETFRIDNVSVSGNQGIVSFSSVGTSTTFQIWQGAAGI